MNDEQDVCPQTELRIPQAGPQSRQVLCAVVSRAWTAVVANPKALSVVNRDSSGVPRKAYLYYSRMPAVLGVEAKFPSVVSWQVEFPSAVDTVGITVSVDSTTGETSLYADHQFGLPFHDLINSRVPQRKR